MDIEFKKFSKIPRLSRDIVITEKIDGTNAQVHVIPISKPSDNMLCDFSKKGWRIFNIHPQFCVGVIPASRNRYINIKKDNYGFAKWVDENSEELLNLGIGRHYGEWWGAGIQRNYDMKEKVFSLFNVAKWEDNRPDCCDIVPVLFKGMFSECAITEALNRLDRDGSYAAPGFMKPEGIVIYHTKGNVLFKKTLENDTVPKSIVREN